jgi:hypothetical protein
MGGCLRAQRPECQPGPLCQRVQIHPSSVLPLLGKERIAKRRTTVNALEGGPLPSRRPGIAIAPSLYLVVDRLTLGEPVPVSMGTRESFSCRAAWVAVWESVSKWTNWRLRGVKEASHWRKSIRKAAASAGGVCVFACCTTLRDAGTRYDPSEVETWLITKEGWKVADAAAVRHLAEAIQQGTNRT